MLQHKEGQRVPAVTFRTRHEGAWRDITTDQIFKGRTVIVFALPGAYTPTCSTRCVAPVAIMRILSRGATVPLTTRTSITTPT